MWHRIHVSLITIILVSGCAIGVKHDYIQGSLELEATPNQAIAIGTLDHRTYVLNSRKKEKYVGMSRGGFGNPFDVVTLSGNPLAVDISTSIASSLRRTGVHAEAYTLSPSQSVTNASKELLSKGAHRTLLLTLSEWKGDSMFNVRFLYDFELRVFDQAGQLLVRKVERGDENLGGSDPFVPGGAEKISDRFKSLMKVLFQDPEVSQHLIDPDGAASTVVTQSSKINVAGNTVSDQSSPQVSDFYGEAEDEINNNTYDKNLWARALVEAEGDETKRKARYIELRASQLYSEEQRRSETVQLDKSDSVDGRTGDWKPAKGEWRTRWGSTSARLKIFGGTRATYNYRNGRILISSIDSEGRWEGYWVEDNGTSGCGNAMKDNSKYWGKIVFQFNDDYTKFKGTWDNCGEGRKVNWNGYR